MYFNIKKDVGLKGFIFTIQSFNISMKYTGFLLCKFVTMQQKLIALRFDQ